ncbi:MAG: hypothetical protein JSS90_00280 [Bacteroidetes bacterium]|jgi:hypothetical protein|nr:hypothetical protein [Bacteroidota bacterium]
MRKTRSMLVITFCMFTLLSKAQPADRQGNRAEKLESMKIGFLTQKLNLTSDEAKRFWPVYNQYQNELQQLRKNRKDEKQEARDNLISMSDKEAEKIVDDEIAFRQNELDILKKYHVQFKQVLPVKKVALLYRSEEAFKRELLQKLRDGGDGKRQP